MTLAKGPYADMRQGRFRSLYYVNTKGDSYERTCNRAQRKGFDAHHVKKSPDITEKGNSFCCMQASVYHPAVV